jgi:hypothetical protein
LDTSSEERNTRPIVIAISTAASLVLAGSAEAAIHNFNFFMDGLQEVPSNASPGTGSCAVTVDDVTNFVDANCTFTGLVSPTTAAHIHAPAPPGVNAGIVLGLSVTPLGGTSGTVTGSGTLSATNIGHILAGNSYINVHTQQFPGGEIRGQIVPEPTTLGLLLLGGAALRLRRR